MRAHFRNGLAVARWLEADPRVERVLYPELESHPQHAVHRKQAKGMSGMLSFYLRGGLAEAKTFLSQLKVGVFAPLFFWFNVKEFLLITFLTMSVLLYCLLPMAPVF